MDTINHAAAVNCMQPLGLCFFGALCPNMPCLPYYTLGAIWLLSPPRRLLWSVLLRPVY